MAEMGRAKSRSHRRARVTEKRRQRTFVGSESLRATMGHKGTTGKPSDTDGPRLIFTFQLVLLR
jgi:hypothetical protein